MNGLELLDRPQPGETVRIHGLRGEFSLTAWRHETGGLVANVFGGTAGHSEFRSVTADRIKAVRPRRKRGEHGR